MNLNEYYRNHKDAINSSIMEIACDLAVGQLLNAHDAPSKHLSKPMTLTIPTAEPITRRSFKRNTTNITTRSMPVYQS